MSQKDRKTLFLFSPWLTWRYALILFGKYYSDDVERNTLGQPIYQDPKDNYETQKKGEYEKVKPN